MEPGERLVTVLATLSVPDTADADDADDADALIAVAADSTALTVVHTTGVEGHLPVPGSTVMRGRQERPWMVHSVGADAAILTDLAGGVIHVAQTALHPDRVDSPTDLIPPRPTRTADLGGQRLPTSDHRKLIPLRGERVGWWRHCWGWGEG